MDLGMMLIQGEAWLFFPEVRVGFDAIVVDTWHATPGGFVFFLLGIDDPNKTMVQDGSWVKWCKSKLVGKMLWKASIFAHRTKIYSV